jgi:hypothetical protein
MRAYGTAPTPKFSVVCPQTIALFSSQLILKSAIVILSEIFLENLFDLTCHTDGLFSLVFTSPSAHSAEELKSIAAAI